MRSEDGLRKKPEMENNLILIGRKTGYNVAWTTWAIRQRQKGGEL